MENALTPAQVSVSLNHDPPGSAETESYLTLSKTTLLNISHLQNRSTKRRPSSS